MVGKNDRGGERKRNLQTTGEAGDYKNKVSLFVQEKKEKKKKHLANSIWVFKNLRVTFFWSFLVISTFANEKAGIFFSFFDKCIKCVIQIKEFLRSMFI